MAKSIKHVVVEMMQFLQVVRQTGLGEATDEFATHSSQVKLKICSELTNCGILTLAEVTDVIQAISSGSMKEEDKAACVAAARTKALMCVTENPENQHRALGQSHLYCWTADHMQILPTSKQ